MAKKTTPQTFTANQLTLSKALSICSKALSEGKILPITEMFLLGINGSKLHIEACDMRIIISTEIAIQSNISDFKLCVPGRKFQDYISKSPNGEMLFEIEKHVIPEVSETKEHPMSGEPYEVVTPEQVSYSLLVKSGQNKAKFNCELGTDFPKIANIEPQQFELPADVLIGMLSKTMFAISDDQLRPSATGLNIRIEPGKVVTTALDFDQVATYTATSANIDFSHDGFIIPKKALQQIQALNPVGALSCNISKSALSVSWGLISATLLLIDEKYPDYLAVTPTENAIDFVTSSSDLANSLKRVLPFADAGKLVKLSISELNLSIEAENIDYSENASETIPGALANGEPIIIGVNGELLLGILNTFSSDEVWFNFGEPNTAIIITDGEKHINPGKENLVLLMPIFLSV